MNAAELDTLLDDLKDMSLAELRFVWSMHLGGVAPTNSASLVRAGLAHELQVKVMGGLSKASLRRLEKIASRRGSQAASRAGLRLVREWQGKAHVVTVSDDGAVHWNDQQFKSLSAVARTITGTQWSGPAFFGLKKKLPKAGTSGLHEAHKPVVQGSESSPNKSEARASRRVGSSSATARQRRTAA